MKLCKCGAPARPGQQTCLPCHAAYSRRWRRDNPKIPLETLKPTMALLVKLMGMALAHEVNVDIVHEYYRLESMFHVGR